jgi:hypothetical protein
MKKTQLTDAQEIQLMSDAVVLSKLARAKLILEVQQGKRALDFVELRNLDKDIKVVEQELERSKSPL